MAYQEALRRVLSSIERRLSKDFIVSSRPDHPHLFDTPDIIVGGRGILSAVFVPKARELKNPEMLLARLIATRLAFPSNTRCFFITIPLLTDEFSATVTEHFDKLFKLEDSGRFVESLSDVEVTGTTRAVPAEIRKQAQKRYELLLRVANLRHGRQPSGADPRELLISLRQSVAENTFPLLSPAFSRSPLGVRTERPRNLLNYHGSEIGIVPIANGQLKSDSISELCAYSFGSSYGLDRGIPYLGRKISPNILLVNRWPERGRDPFKPVRAAAFAGWAFTAAQDSEDVTLLADRLQKIFAHQLK
ncbi:MAG: hypothetical protein WD688_21125 [Candidatus Binatia bacterium]